MTPLPDIRRLRAWLRRGGVIAYATESCFGLGCDPRNARAVRRILALKGRPQAKGLILIGSEFRQFARFLVPVRRRSPAVFRPGAGAQYSPVARLAALSALADRAPRQAGGAG